MADVRRDDLVAVVHMGLGVVTRGRRFGQTRQYVDACDRARGVHHTGRFRGNTLAQRLEYLELTRDDPFVGAENLLLVVLQLRRDVTLAAGYGLLANEVGRHGVQIRLGDFDEVSKRTTEPDLERFDAGPRAFTLLHFGNDLLAGAADAA